MDKNIYSVGIVDTVVVVVVVDDTGRVDKINTITPNRARRANFRRNFLLHNFHYSKYHLGILFV